MPELPEVEHFRRLLLPLVSGEYPLRLERLSLEKKPPRNFIADEEISDINQKDYCLTDVIRKGKLIVMLLEVFDKTGRDDDGNDRKISLLVHMGMTGRISTPDQVVQIESMTSKEYPPLHTFLKFSNDDAEACFSDPRKFGYVQMVRDHTPILNALAPDAWNEASNHRESILHKLVNQSMGIKAILLDQKRVVSGVGNWIADEVLYHSELHPDQNFLTTEQGQVILAQMKYILQSAVERQTNGKSLPKDWLFHRRWRHGKKEQVKDAKGRLVTFVTSGGRTSAVVPSLQKKKSQARVAAKGRTKADSKGGSSDSDKVDDEKAGGKEKPDTPKSHKTKRKSSTPQPVAKKGKVDIKNEKELPRRRSPRLARG